MKLAATLIAVGTLFASTALVSAEGVSDQTPGHQMQTKGSVKGTAGASGYAPGRKMQERGSVKGTTGASGYAPGHETTGAGASGSANIKAGGASVKGSASGSVR